MQSVSIKSISNDSNYSMIALLCCECARARGSRSGSQQWEVHVARGVRCACAAQGELRTLVAQSQFLCVPHADYQRIMARQAERIVRVQEGGRVVLVKQTLQQPPAPLPTAGPGPGPAPTTNSTPATTNATSVQPATSTSPSTAPPRPLHLILKVCSDSELLLLLKCTV